MSDKAKPAGISQTIRYDFCRTEGGFERVAYTDSDTWRRSR